MFRHTPASTNPADPLSASPPVLWVGRGDAHQHWLRSDERRGRMDALLTLALLLVWFWLGVRIFSLETAWQDASRSGCSASGASVPPSTASVLPPAQPDLLFP